MPESLIYQILWYVSTAQVEIHDGSFELEGPVKSIPGFIKVSIVVTTSSFQEQSKVPAEEK
jgi:hypothetical protein